MIRLSFLATAILLLLSIAGFAQNKGSIKGKLIDSLDQSVMEYATIAVVEPKDSSLISYTLSIKDGTFALKNLPAERSLRLLISFVGYETYRKTINLQKGETKDLGTIGLARRSLKEVVITGERQAILIKKDTIEFSPEAFKTKPNAVLEDLLKKLPGLQVDVDGTITVNGRRVNKITIDGKDFFVSDLTIASKNINVDLIDKVQVVDDREDDPDRLKDASQVDKIINLKLKKAIKKSAFGKVYAGGGSSDRFEGGGLLNIFRDTLQVSLIGFGNNVNRSAFSNSELNSMGGFARSENLNSSGVNFGGRYWGLQKVASGGVNVNYDWKKKLKLNLMYFYGNTVNDYGNDGDQQTFIQDTTLNSNYFYSRTQEVNKHNLSGLFQWKIDTVTNIRFLPKMMLNSSSGSSRSEGSTQRFQKLLNTSDNRDRESGNSFQYEHQLTFYHRSKKNKQRSLSISNNIRINPADEDSYRSVASTVFAPLKKDSLLDNNSYREHARNSVSLEIYYRHPLSKKVVSDWTLSTSFQNDLQVVNANNYNPITKSYDIFIPSLSSDLGRDQITYRFRPGITWNITKKRTLRAAAVMQLQELDNRFNTVSQRLKRNYFSVFPSVRYSADQFSVSYDANLRMPDISQLQPFPFKYSMLYTYEGNPDLQPVISHNFNLSYNKFIPSSQINYSFNGSLNLQENDIIYLGQTDGSGATFRSPMNVDGTYYSNSSIHFSKRFKKVHNWQFRVMSGLTNYMGKRVFMQNLVQDDQYYYNVGLRAGFSLGWKEIFNLEPNYTLGRNINRYTIQKQQNKDFYNHSLNNQLVINWPKKVTIEASHSFNYDSQVARGYDKTSNLLNASISYKMLKKDRGEIKLTGFDLLDENTGVYSWIGNNVVSTGRQVVLHRYFLLSYIFNFNKTVTK